MLKFFCALSGHLWTTWLQVAEHLDERFCMVCGKQGKRPAINEEVSAQKLREVLRDPGEDQQDPSLIIPAGHYLGKGGEIRKAVTLREKLIANRISQKRGSGDRYWDSVMSVIDHHYNQMMDTRERSVKVMIANDEHQD